MTGTNSTDITSNLSDRLKKLVNEKQVICTDFFNVFKLPKSTPTGFENFTVITYNSIDQLIFSQWFTTLESTVLSDYSNTILINPPTIQANVAIIYTEPRTGITAQVFFYNLHKLNINNNASRTLQQSQQQPIQPLHVNTMWIDPCGKSGSCSLYGDNPTYDVMTKFRLIMLLLAVNNVSITQHLYSKIKKLLNNYHQYRAISMSCNRGKIIAEDLYKPLDFCRTTRSGVKPY